MVAHFVPIKHVNQSRRDQKRHEKRENLWKSGSKQHCWRSGSLHSAVQMMSNGLSPKLKRSREIRVKIGMKHDPHLATLSAACSYLTHHHRLRFQRFQCEPSSLKRELNFGDCAKNLFVSFFFISPWELRGFVCCLCPSVCCECDIVSSLLRNAQTTFQAFHSVIAWMLRGKFTIPLFQAPCINADSQPSFHRLSPLIQYEHFHLHENNFLSSTLEAEQFQSTAERRSVRMLKAEKEKIAHFEARKVKKILSEKKRKNQQKRDFFW